ncbi:H-NS family nucleoid-associated regulatory protein [Paraburkholderia elongata]|uniref:H-NS family nucleoid-associated regulatory protein n=1 Tax=Paraburkholderia elongata TaxID=2675747 RepID=UPI002E2C5F68|nr:H-NS family nucleoid-associated regulatory protein [Paraburkholderia elongata]
MKEAASQTKGKLPPKYINPKTGETWSGHARPPAWIANVKDRTKFLIAGSAEATVAATAGVVGKSKAAVKKAASKSVGATGSTGQRKGPQPALYREPKSGATWSGRGRAPTWLAGAKDRSKFLIDAAEAVGDAKPAVTKVVAKKAPTTKKPAAKKAVSAMPAVKRASAKKAASAAVKKALAKKTPRKSVA